VAAGRSLRAAVCTDQFFINLGGFVSFTSIQHVGRVSAAPPGKKDGININDGVCHQSQGADDSPFFI
jgi:hypothetical protein